MEQSEFAALAEVFRGYLDKALDPMRARMANLEARIDALPDLRGEFDVLEESVAAIERVSSHDLLMQLEARVRLPQDGKDADPEAIRAMVDEATRGEVTRVLETWPRPVDGRSLSLDEVRPLIVEEVARIPPARDGIGVAGALIDRDGILVLTLTNGEPHKLGLVIGKDGAAGKDGKDGADGLGFDDLAVEELESAFVVRFSRGDKVKEFTLAKPTLADWYRGVWREGTYKRGDWVTWGGSMFLAIAATDSKPATSEDWRLVVKHGQDGRDRRDAVEAPKAKVTLR